MRTYIITEEQFDKLISGNREKGIEILSTLIRKRFPYITSIEVNSLTETHDTLYINLHVDLNKFYKITNTTPPRDYFEKTGIDGEYFLLDLLNNTGLYMRRYVDKKYKDDYSWEFNQKLEKLFSNYYKSLPSSVTYKKFEDYLGNDPFYIKWKSERLPMDIKIETIYPQVDVDKLLMTK